MNGMIEAFLMWFLVWHTDYQRCNAEEIANIAVEYVPRYVDAETREEWEMLIIDLQSEVISQCKQADRPSA